MSHSPGSPDLQQAPGLIAVLESLPAGLETLLAGPGTNLHSCSADLGIDLALDRQVAGLHSSPAELLENPIGRTGLVERRTGSADTAMRLETAAAGIASLLERLGTAAADIDLIRLMHEPLAEHRLPAADRAAVAAETAAVVKLGPC